MLAVGGVLTKRYVQSTPLGSAVAARWDALVQSWKNFARPRTGAGCPPNLAPGRGGRGANKLKPDPNATGPHSTWKTDADGNTIGHAEWKPNARNPSGFDPVKRVDLQGNPHYNKATGQDMPTPHVHEKGIPGGVRPARPDEIPGGGGN
jgi:hypothetical protein